MKHLIILATMVLIVTLGFLGGKVDTSEPGWISFNEAKADSYRRNVRSVARRTARRTVRRQNYYNAPVSTTVVVAAPVPGIAIGTIITALPAACSTLLVNGMNYYFCSGSYFVAAGTQWVVVAAP